MHPRQLCWLTQHMHALVTHNKPFGDHCFPRRFLPCRLQPPPHPPNLPNVPQNTLNRETSMQPMPAGSCQVQLCCQAAGWAQQYSPRYTTSCSCYVTPWINSTHPTGLPQSAVTALISLRSRALNEGCARYAESPIDHSGPARKQPGGNWQQHKPPLLSKHSASRTNCSPAATVHNSHHHLNPS